MKQLTLLAVLALLSPLAIADAQPTDKAAATKLTVSGPDEVRIPLVSCLSKELRELPFVNLVDEGGAWWIDIAAAKAGPSSWAVSKVIYKIEWIHMRVDVVDQYSTPRIAAPSMQAFKQLLPETALTAKSHTVAIVGAADLKSYCSNTAMDFHVTYIEPVVRQYQQYKNSSK